MILAERFVVELEFRNAEVFQNDTRTLARLKTAMNSSALYFSLREYPLEVLLYAMARIEEQEYTQLIATYIRDLRGIKLEINGDDVVKLGMKQGPEVRELLDDVLKARLDGRAPTREEQLKLASVSLSVNHEIF